MTCIAAIAEARYLDDCDQENSLSEIISERIDDAEFCLIQGKGLCVNGEHLQDCDALVELAEQITFSQLAKALCLGDEEAKAELSLLIEKVAQAKATEFALRASK